MEETSQSYRRLKEELDRRFPDAHSNCRTHCGLCCVCHTLPTHSRSYYGHVFCIECFHKYIWSPSKRECSGDVKNRQKEDIDNGASKSTV